jgi:hypothetical protein
VVEKFALGGLKLRRRGGTGWRLAEGAVDADDLVAEFAEALPARKRAAVDPQRLGDRERAPALGEGAGGGELKGRERSR